MGKELGEKISSILKEYKISQKELAYLLNVSEVVVSRYISGERNPKPEVLANIATALHTSSDFLLGLEDRECSGNRALRIIARNSKNWSKKEKEELIKILTQELDK